MLAKYLEINGRILEGLEGPIKRWEYPWGRCSQGCRKNECVARADELLSHMPNPPRIRVGGLKAVYRYGIDLINLPYLENFNRPEEFLSTKFHELIHSTGSVNRLARVAIVKRCKKDQLMMWSEENIIAELGAIYLCSMVGADDPATFGNSIAYLQGCLWDLGDNRSVMKIASAHAIQAVEHICGV